MKRLIIFLLLFAAIKVAGQTTGYLRFDTVKIMKQNGTCELYIINKTKDSTGGVLTNIGGGLTSFRKTHVSGDTLFVGGDTVIISGTGKLDSVTIETATDPDPDSLFEWRGSTRSFVGLIPKGGGSSGQLTTITEGPVYVKAGDSALNIPDTLAVRYDTTTITIRTTGVNDSALTVNTNNIVTVQRLADSLAAHPTLIVDTVVYTHSGAESDTTTHTELIGKTIISLEAHPYNLHLATSYPPATEEVYVNTVTGGTKFGTALQSGQTVTWIYKYLTTTGTPVVEGVQVNGGAVQTGIVSLTIPTSSFVAGKSIRSAGDTILNRIDVGDSSYAVLAGVLRPTFDTANLTNSWAWINNTDHGNINIKDSVAVTSTGVQIFYDSSLYEKVVTFLIVNDETISRIAQTTGSFQGKAGALFWSNGGYTSGASVGLTNATITLSSLRGLSVQVVWNGSAWVMTNVGQNAINFNSTSPTISYSAGRLRIQSLPFNMKQFPAVMGYAPNGVDSLVGYQPAIEVISQNWVDIYFWDSKNNVKYTAATPPTNFGVYVNFGLTFAACNPQTEDFGFNSNLWVIAIMKKIYLPSFQP